VYKKWKDINTKKGIILMLLSIMKVMGMPIRKPIIPTRQDMNTRQRDILIDRLRQERRRQTILLM
jgi:hypothetical protein